MKRVRERLYIFAAYAAVLSVLRMTDGYPLLAGDHLGAIAWFGAGLTALTISELIWSAVKNRTRKE
ncbi:hypothetical protein [Spirillospora albida]|uniref:hypothetical protein n=1 Tax=Spirillospora albida TaxID=58123 RepID=UPI0004BFFF69|nr:hypothetical protein [Spirillospora albida]